MVTRCPIGKAVSFANVGSAVYLTTHPKEGWQQTAAALNAAENAERAGLSKYGALGDAAGAVRAAVMYNNFDNIWGPCLSAPTHPTSAV